MAWTPPTYEWAIYYDDGSVYTSEDGAPHESPIAGAVLILQPAVYARNFVGRGDAFFIYRSDLGEWFDCDLPGLLDQLAHFSPVIPCVRVGRWMTSVAWTEVQKRATYALRGPKG